MQNFTIIKPTYLDKTLFTVFTNAFILFTNAFTHNLEVIYH